jgi:ubiquitin-conjugating enzyme E2 W
MEGAQGTLYEGERFQLQFKFSAKYPFDSPEVSTVMILCL